MNSSAKIRSNLFRKFKPDKKESALERKYCQPMQEGMVNKVVAQCWSKSFSIGDTCVRVMDKNSMTSTQF
ncbi:hypothetical protein Y032_0332g2754 [Ancylostoma ceylanicum]|uniref:Uncharacterized protein n=1 Tax=Ancylostoma ceylanicum TaxID=53326 RepID=A0A016S055_9BILA|nr:hypothetical protein Y032_0332g2754 [Ancylostoma ceylanicum]